MTSKKRRLATTDPRRESADQANELAGLIEEFDWAKTPIGPRARWPQSLKTAVGIMLTSRQPIWIGWGKDLTYLYNDPYKSIIGGKHPRAIGQPTSVVWKEIWGDIAPMLSQAMGGQQGTYVESQLLIMERNGYPEETYYTFSYSPIPDDDGGVGGIFCANSDDTARTIGERQLALLRELAAATGDARTWQQACERSARALATNPRDLPFAAIYILAPDQDEATLAGQSGLDDGHPALGERLRVEDGTNGWPLRQVLASNAAATIDLVRVSSKPLPTGAWAQPPRQAIVLPISSSGKTGRSGFLIAGLNPFRLLDDSYMSFLTLVAGQIAAAIANAEAYEEERRRAEALAAIDRAKTAFFSNVSHEFRTPLTLMLSPLEEVLDSPDSELKGMDLVAVAHRNGVRLLKLVNSLLDYSRVEAGKADANFEAVDLVQITTEVARTFEPIIRRAGLQLHIEADDISEPVFVDRDMWEKIIFNLLSNAFKFTFTGQILVEIRRSAGAVDVSVADTGTGIPADQLPRLFERFYRVEGARGRSIEGSGIGLALVQELVKLHGGHIDVESTSGVGTRFKLSLPLGRQHLPAHQLRGNDQLSPTAVRAQAYLQEAAGWLGDETPDLPAASGAQDLGLHERVKRAGRILLADDNVDMRNYIERLLASAGYQVDSVENGAAALELARKTRPALILSDVMMPELDGFGLLTAVRDDPRMVDTPIILISARAGEESKVEGLRAGADDYLIKPFSARELLARVETNIKLAETRRETARLLREEAEVLELLNRVGTAVAAEVDLELAVQLVTDTATQLSGAAFGSFFYNVIDDKGESYTLYTLSGVSREAFSRFPMPRNTAVFSPTFKGEGTVRSDDITQDERFGKNEPYHGMPEGHLPVRSYLAVPVKSRGGEVLGGLFFGHPERGVFTARAERIVSAIAAQAAIAIDKARLYRAAQVEIARRKQVEADLRLSEQQLEARVRDRTAELSAAYERLLAETTQREDAERHFELLVKGVTDYAVFMLSPTGHVANWNAGAERIKGYTETEIVGRHFQAFYTDHDREAGIPAKALETALRDGKFEAEGYRVRKDGTQFWASVVINPIFDGNRELIGFAKVTRDITEKRETQQALVRAQEQLLQAQKMEGIGQLTGGVAHDFNNLLTVIIGNLEAVGRNLGTGAGGKNERYLETAMRGAQRAASLTQRLLAFSRRQPLDPKPIDLGRLLSGMSDLLRRTLGEHIAIETVLTGGLWRVLVDPNQLEVAILNLAVNSRDAMPDGGKLTIETANVYLDESYAAAQAEVVPGQYVAICVTDSGTGMSREIMTRVFEPFFTTKDIGHGTGLGLSQVYGFVKQSGGNVKIYSEQGQGTTVKIYLPRLHSDEERAEESKTIEPAPKSSSGQTILVVEDEADVRAHTTGILQELGYRVLEASTGSSGLAVLQNHPEIQLLFTDVGLPGGMNGRQLADTARTVRPDLKVLFTTGYARNAIVHGGRLDPGVTMIPKPFTYAAVAAKIADMLERAPMSNRVLLVEDEILIQMLATDYLEQLGYTVETAANAADALNKAKLLNGELAFAMIDLGLPDIGGDILARELRALYAHLPIVIASGSKVDPRSLFGDARQVMAVNKPYTFDDIAEVSSKLKARG